MTECPRRINELNMMPTDLEEVRRDEANGSVGDGIILSNEREESSIPRHNENKKEDKWQYPSQRMFYNALQRKGKGVDKEGIEGMLMIHNAINEKVWEELCELEEKLNPSRKACIPSLVRFQGKPSQLSPTAFFYSKILKGHPPFDRHDWIIDRCGQGRRRYVIDYYGGSANDSDPATFSVHIRPAIDNFSSLWERLKMLFF